MINRVTMDRYAIYTFSYKDSKCIQGNLLNGENVGLPDPSEDKNKKLDFLFGSKNTDVRVQRLKKNKVADKYPCTVLEHQDRVIWIRIENEKIVRVYEKSAKSTQDVPAINRMDIKSHPYSYVFFDCREGKNLIAIKIDSDSWRSTDTIANSLQASLNQMMEELGWGFEIIIEPVTMPKDFWDYNRRLIKTKKQKVKKMTIFFTTGKIDPRAEDVIKRSPYLKRLINEVWSSTSGQVTLNNPEGSKIVDGRKRDIKNIIELITEIGCNDSFGLSLTYENGQEVSCGKDVRIDYPMNADTFDMLFNKNLFNDCNINEWLDNAVEYIKQQKNETTAEPRRKSKNPKRISETSLALGLL